MKSVTEMRESASEAAKELAGMSRKAGYAAVGAPVVAGRKIAEMAGKLSKSATGEFELWVAEGEKVAAQLRDRNVVEELRERVDFDQLQGRVEKLRDQLEEVLTNWRETFIPHGEELEAKPAAKPAAKKAPAKKAAKPAAKKAPGQQAAKPAAKKAPAKKAATTKAASA